MQGTQLSFAVRPTATEPFTVQPEQTPSRNPSAHQPLSAPGIFASGEKSKARDIIAAIRTLKAIEQEQRPATPDEQQTLARFAGFGASGLVDFPRSGHRQIQGRRLAGPRRGAEDRCSRPRNTTAPNAPRSMPSTRRRPSSPASTRPSPAWACPQSATILEPGCGTGNFMSQGKPGNRFIGVELDAISGRIARALHPEHDIRIESFRDTTLPENRIDAVIGNVPFADLKLDYHGQKFSLHDYFFAKSIDALKPGGVLALVTSHFTLDKQNAGTEQIFRATSERFERATLRWLSVHQF